MKCALPKLSTTYRVNFFKLKSLENNCARNLCSQAMLFKNAFSLSDTLTTYVLWEMSLWQRLVGTIFFAISYLILNSQLHHCLGQISLGKCFYFFKCYFILSQPKSSKKYKNHPCQAEETFCFDILCFQTYAYPNTSIDSFNNKFYKCLMSMYYVLVKLLSGEVQW